VLVFAFAFLPFCLCLLTSLRPYLLGFSFCHCYTSLLFVPIYDWSFSLSVCFCLCRCRLSFVCLLFVPIYDWSFSSIVCLCLCRSRLSFVCLLFVPVFLALPFRIALSFVSLFSSSLNLQLCRFLRTNLRFLSPLSYTYRLCHFELSFLSICVFVFFVPLNCTSLPVFVCVACLSWSLCPPVFFVGPVFLYSPFCLCIVSGYMSFVVLLAFYLYPSLCPHPIVFVIFPLSFSLLSCLFICLCVWTFDFHG
jgi:hypothetical protein